MKDLSQENYGENLPYNQLKQAFQEAWDQVSPWFLDKVLNSVKERYQAVIVANGLHTSY